MENNIYQFTVQNIKNESVNLSDLKDKVVLIVNTASACGFTKQYKQLEELYLQYQSKGLEILAFPCNQFGQQEKGNSEEIAQFCNLRFNITFPLMKKINVNGDDAEPLYHYLKRSQKGLLGTQSIKWNFTKFLINKQGVAVNRYAPMISPDKLTSRIKQLLSS